MILRRVKYIVTLLLILSSFAAMTAESNLFTRVQGAPGFLDLTPNKGPTGIDVKISGSVTTGVVNNDASCSVSSPTNPNTVGVSACQVNGGGSTTGNFTGSFTVGPVAPGQYVIEVTACAGNNGCAPSAGDFVQAVFNVTSGPTIKLSPATGQPGTHVLVNGTGFSVSDTNCAIVGSNVVLPGTQACAIHAGSGIVNASFTVANVLPGQYLVQINGNTGDNAQAIFNVVSGPIIKLSPATGQPGAHVLVNGTGFLPTDSSCAIVGSNVVLSGTQACVIHQGSGIVNASFTVANVPPGQYLVQINGNQGDSAQAIFNVVSGPAIKLSPASGQTGAHILVNGTGFLPTDQSCSISSISVDINGHGPIAPGTAGCVIRVGSGIVNASFTIGNVLPGQYVIEVTGCGGNNGCAPSAGDFAQAVLNVVSGPLIKLSPGSGRTGVHVLVNGTGFLPTDTTCAIVGSNPLILSGSQACAIHAGTGIVNASFTVADVPPGQYLVQVNGNQGDSAQAVFDVLSGPQIALSPATGSPGTHVLVNGTGFLPQDTLCQLVSPSSNLVNPILPGTAACVIRAGTGLVNASFTVGNVLPGQYVIEVDAFQGTVVTITTTTSTTAVTSSTTSAVTSTSTTIAGQEFAQAILNVVSGPLIKLSPATGQPGTHVLVNGTGFLPTDTSCAIVGGNVVLPGTQACVIRAGSGIVNASFTVANVLPGQYVVQVSGNQGDFAQAIFNVISGPIIKLSPATGQPGTHVLVNGTGFLPTDTTCAIVGGNVVLPGTQACVIKAGSGIVNASFTVAAVPPGQYLVEINGNQGDFAQAIFNVVSGPVIKLSPATGQPGTHVLVNGTGFLPTDNTCAIVGSNVVEPGTQACVIHQGSGIVNASFTVNNVLPGQYLVQITAGPGGDFAQAIFNVVSGPSIKLSPATAQPGAHILVNGTGFLPTDQSCSLSSPSAPNPILTGTAACVIHVGSGVVNASFTIASVLPGQYVIEITGCGGNNGCAPSVGDFAQAVLNVVNGPRIKLSPATGQPGTHVLVNGTGFLPTDTSCAIVGSNVVEPGTQACVIGVGSGVVNASFTVNNVLPGQYIVQVNGNTGDSAQAIFNVISGPLIKLSPATGAPGTHVLVNGTGFLPTDNTCAIVGSNVVEPGTQACVIHVGSGIVNASFTVNNVLPGQYVVQISGSGGDFAQAIFNVINGPRLTLSPASGMVGTEIIINGTGFLPTDQSCSISGGTPNLVNPVLPGSAGCSIAVGTGNVTGSFIIGSVSPGEYTIEVTGCGGNNGCAPSAGDFATKVLRVLPSGKTLILSASNSTEESTVSFVGTGLSPTDTSCMLLAYNAKPPPGQLDTNLITSPTCSIVTPGVAQGTFVVSPYATTDIQWNLTVRGNPVEDITAFAVFNVTADVIVTPTSGTIHTVFTFTGSGFSSKATLCNVTIVPPFPSGSNAGCYMSANIGQVSGSVVVPLNTVPGTYAMYVKDNTGKLAAGVFTVGTPSALVVLNPATVGQGQPVGVAGFGFNPNDTFCTISSPASATLFTGTPTCLIAGGYASGAFTVSSSTPGGYYLIIVRACSTAPVANVCTGTALDFASNFLGVTLATTITTFSTTTTSSSTTTSLSTTTTSVATSFSFSSTTYSTTGILFTTYTHFTVNTVSGQTTTVITSTSSTTQTQTTVTYSTTTQFTTVPCGPLPCGFQTQPTPYNTAPGIDSAGLLAALLLLIPMLLRRLFT